MAAVALFFTGCNDYLDVVPKADIKDIPSTFETREDAIDWAETCMSMRDLDIENIDKNPAYWGSDELVADDWFHESSNPVTYNGNDGIPGFMIAEGYQKTQNPYGTVWSATKFYGGIRYCNLFLDQIGGTYGMTAEEKNFWIAEVRACKAHFYFELMRRYGPIILVPENIDANSSVSDMQQPRSSIDDCVNAIVELLDSAIAVLPIQSGMSAAYNSFYSREGAATLKAMTLLYAASPLFNGNAMFARMTNKNGERLFPEYDKEKWHRAAVAADEAIQIAKDAGHKLMNGSSERPTELLNKMLDLENSWNEYQWTNTEALVMMHTHENVSNRYYFPKFGSSYEQYADNWTSGGISATMKMAEMFYTDHGLPLSEDKQWMPSRYQMSKENDSKYRNVVRLGVNVLNLHRHREPRFYASLISHGTCWYHKMNAYMSTMQGIECNMLQGQIMGTSQKVLTSAYAQNITGYYVKKFDVSKIGLRNYTYVLNTAGDAGTILFRLPDLLLASSEAWNEYLDAADERVYAGIDEVRERAGIPKVRDAWDTFARNPQNARTKDGMREIIHQEENVEFAFEGRRFYNLRRWMTAPEELNQPVYGWNILGDTEQKFFNNFEGPKVVWRKRSFTAPRDYFIPINAEEILISGCKQNIGWGNE